MRGCTFQIYLIDHLNVIMSDGSGYHSLRWTMRVTLIIINYNCLKSVKHVKGVSLKGLSRRIDVQED